MDFVTYSECIMKKASCRSIFWAIHVQVCVWAWGPLLSSLSEKSASHSVDSLTSQYVEHSSHVPFGWEPYHLQDLTDFVQPLARVWPNLFLLLLLWGWINAVSWEHSDADRSLWNRHWTIPVLPAPNLGDKKWKTCPSCSLGNNRLFLFLTLSATWSYA